MSDIKRYSAHSIADALNTGNDPCPSNTGEYVRFDDVSATIDTLAHRNTRAYSERAAVIRLAAGLAMACGLEAGIYPKELKAWENVVYIDLPNGQVSFHIEPHDWHMFADLPEYKGVWDGTFKSRGSEYATSFDHEAIKTKRFNFAYCMAVSNLISLHGADVQALDLFRELNIDNQTLDQLDLSEFDVENFKKLKEQFGHVNMFGTPETSKPALNEFDEMARQKVEGGKHRIAFKVEAKDKSDSVVSAECVIADLSKQTPPSIGHFYVNNNEPCVWDGQDFAPVQMYIDNLRNELEQIAHRYKSLKLAQATTYGKMKHDSPSWSHLADAMTVRTDNITFDKIYDYNGVAYIVEHVDKETLRPQRNDETVLVHDDDKLHFSNVQKNTELHLVRDGQILKRIIWKR